MRHLEDSGPSDYAHDSPRNFIEVLRARAHEKPNQPLYIYLENGETESGRLSYGGLDRRARAIAARLQAMNMTGERALLLYPQGLAYIEAFFGCLYAGVIAVPAYPPARQHLQRLHGIMRDAAPAIVMTTAGLLPKLQSSLIPERNCVWLASDALSDGASTWEHVSLDANSLAFLQYTSGSTGDPKGVMVSHGNLLANQKAIKQSFGHDEHSTVVGWLPLYHDMGLIGNILQPLYIGSTAILMPPMAFLEKPLRWLQAISTYRAATSGGPNFAYDLCVRKVSEQQKQNLDLNAWRLAFNGSEPVRRATLERFATAFASCGFQRPSFFPCYGMAETTLFVSGEKLAVTEEVNTPDHPATVACGVTAAQHEVRIVDPHSGLDCSPGQEGEIWVSGPSVALGYWNRQEDSDALFRARIEDSATDRTYLRTGDLGILQQDRLHITGRIKELIIIRGRNYYPQDIEHTATEALESLRNGGCAAFSVSDQDEEGVVLVAEITRDAMRLADYETIFASLRSIVAEVCEVAPVALVLVPPGGAPKTSSGKLRRLACKQAYLDGTLPALAQSSHPETPCSARSSQTTPVKENLTEAEPDTQLLREALSLLAPAQRAPLIARFLRSRVARLLKAAESGIPSDVPLTATGLDSLKRIELKHTADLLLGIDTPLSLFMSDSSLEAIAQRLAETTPTGAEQSELSTLDNATQRSFALSSTQLSMWTMQQMEPNSVVYNLHLALRIEGAVDITLLRQALAKLVERHGMLRTRYRSEHGLVTQALVSPQEIPDFMTSIAALNWPATALQNDFAQRIRTPFDLEQGQVFHATLYHTTDNGQQGQTLLLCAHHIAVDLWSVLILIGELKSIYDALTRGHQPSLYHPGIGYAAFVAGQQRYLNSELCEQDWNYWRRQLDGDLPLLALPTDHPRPSAPDYRGASAAIRLNMEETQRLKELAAQQGVSLFTLLLAAYKTLLHRYTHQRDMIVGVPASGRSQARFAPVVGVFVNPLPLRTHPAAATPFLNYLNDVNATLRNALEHQALPFNVLVERLQPERSGDHWPIYQSLFILQQAQTGISDELAQFSLGEESAPLTWDDWQVRSVGIRQRVENFDLKLMSAESQSGLIFSFQYRQELFEPSTIARMAQHFKTLLYGIIDAPNTRLGDLPLLCEAERRRILTEWNPTRVDNYPKPGCLHELFEEQAATKPEAVAVSCGEDRLTYRELNRRAHLLASYLQTRGVKPEIRVGLCVERSVDAIVGILGILKAGGVYVPLDPNYPRQRIADTLTDCAATLLLTHARRLTELPETNAEVICLDRDWTHIAGLTVTPPKKLTQASNAAYLIYTSGSTGKAKGVVISHGNALASTLARFQFYQEAAVEGFLLLSSFAFDSSIAGIFWTLSQGGRLCIPSEENHQDTKALSNLIARERLTHLLCLPSFYTLLLESGQHHSLITLRTVIVAGETCPTALAAKHYQCLPGTLLCNEYGPTEGTVWSSAYRVPASSDEATQTVPIGRTIAHSRIYLLDTRLNPVPVGVSGEVYIGGNGIARCYFNRPDLTAERYLPDLFDSGTGARMYKSGDLARRRPDGTIEFIGRTDQQVKIRGYRIELGEIETRLSLHPEVKEAAVIVLENPPGTKRLTAYWVATTENPATQPTAVSLRAFLIESLPDYMVPAVFIALDAMPLMPNGKPDRKALPAPDYNGLFAKQYVAPGNLTEKTLIELWTNLLPIENIGIHDNFFDLGGDSILAIQVAINAHKAGLSITPRQIFQHQTVAELATAIQYLAPAETAPEIRAFSLSRLTRQELEALPFDQADIEDIYPLTPMQEGMLFHSLMAPHSGIYLMQDRFELHGAVDPESFGKAWNQVIQRHTVLRTSFVWNTQSVPHQIVHRRMELPFEYYDWGELSSTLRETRLNDLLRNEREQGFDLERPPLLRLRLFRLAEGRYRFVRSHHHILLDAWCTSLLLMEFKACYDALLAGRTRPPETNAPPFRNYISWLQSQHKKPEETFWRGYLAGFTESTPLTVDHVAVDAKSTEIADIALQFSETATQRLNELAQQCRVTVNTFVQGAWAVLLSRYSGTNEVLFGITVAGRPAELANVEEILGLFINGLPLRVAIDPTQPVLEFLHTLLEQNLELRQFEHTALTQIREWSEIPADQELFRHLLTFENAPIDPKLRGRSDSFEFTGVAVRTHTNYPVTVMVIPEAGLHLQISYQTARFDASAIDRMLRHLKQLLEDIIAHPYKRVGELEMLTPPERRRIIEDWNRTEHAYPEPGDWVARFEAQAAHTPNAVAVACLGTLLSYQELNTRANRLAHALIAKGVRPDVIVALLNQRGIDFAIMIVAVFKAGGAYLPLDPAHPDTKLAQTITESRCSLILTGEDYAERARTLLLDIDLPRLYSIERLEAEQYSVDNPVSRHTPRNLAVVISTSGSTGHPKGAMVEYRGMFNNLITKLPTLELTQRDVIAQTAGQCFDISVWQHLTALVCGARVEIFPDDVVKEPHRLLHELTVRGVTILEAVPSMIQVLLEMAEENALPGLRWLIASGEAFPAELCSLWMSRFPHIRVLNAYGPAECSDDVSYHEVLKPFTDTVVPVGRPADNTRLYLLDARLEPVPVGVPGEICVSGIQVGRGYLRRPDLTAEKFMPDPFSTSGERLYRSGDLGRYRADGSIEFLSRTDHQLKIRGFRIEPGEIEAHLLKLPDIEQVLVIAHKTRQHDQRLIAYLVYAQANLQNDAERTDQLRAYLSARLPNYMVPSVFIQLDSMPLNSNGKIDRKALPEPDSAVFRENSLAEPGTPTERMLVEIWKEVLDVGHVGVKDSFFDLGGHSLLAMRVMSRMRAAFGVEIPLQELFGAFTIEQHAILVEEYIMEQLDNMSDEEALALLEEEY